MIKLVSGNITFFGQTFMKTSCTFRDCGWDPVVWPFKWKSFKLFMSFTFLQYCFGYCTTWSVFLLSLLSLTMGDHSNESYWAVLFLNIQNQGSKKPRTGRFSPWQVTFKAHLPDKLRGWFDPRGYSTKLMLIRGDSAPRSNPLYPFRIPSIDKWYSFHTPCLELCISFDRFKWTVF